MKRYLRKYAYFPNKTKFPLIYKIMRPSASQYFETNVSNGFYPYLESTLSHRKKRISGLEIVFLLTSLNLLLHMFLKKY